MKIGINATYAASKFLTGIGNYTHNLIKHILLIDKKNQYTLYYKYRIKRKDFLPFLVSSQYYEPFLSRFSFKKIDIFHDPAVKYTRIGKSKCVVTIHDIVTALEEDYTSAHFKKTQKPKLLKSIKYADHIISVSEFTKNEVMHKFGVPEDKISVVYHGIDHNIFNTKIIKKEIFVKYRLPQKFFLFVGNIEQRKNIRGMINVFEKVNLIYPDIGLVLIGQNGYQGERIRNEIEQSKIKGKIIMIPYLLNDELPAFYQNAFALLFPSFYEGFGLPVLEAMACDCPVITSNAASMPEVGGEAVLYGDPFNIDSIIKQILLLIQNPSLRKEVIQKGREQVKKFTWEKAAQETLRVYEKIL